MLVTVMLALAAYVPTCFCWTETVATWMMGSGAAATGHVCCGEHEGVELAPQSGQGGHDERQYPPLACLMDCVCGVQHRIVSQPTLSSLDFEPVLVGWVTPEIAVELGLKGAGPRIGMWVESGVGTGGAGARTLLRQHCALTI